MDIIDIKQANAGAGHHFFEASAMRFFRSRVGSKVYPDGMGGAYFVTSEQFPGPPAGPRLYSVRHSDAKGRIRTIGEFQGYTTARNATAVAKKLAAGTSC